MRRVLELDYRSLALFRIALGVVLTLDWVSRGAHRVAHYSGEGVLPLSRFLEAGFPDPNAGLFSLLYLSDDPRYVTAFFALGLASAIALTVGYRTRISGPLCWLLLLSVQHRNPLLLHKGDSYLLLLLLWGSLLPWGEAFALDVPRRHPESPPLSVAGVAYLTQVFLVYACTAAMRTSQAWSVDGTALYDAFHLAPLSRPTSDLVLAMGPRFTAAVTLTIWGMESFGPALLWLPYARARMLAVGLIVAFHLSIEATMYVFNFAWIAIAAPLGLLPAEFWSSRLGRMLERGLRRLFPARPAAEEAPPRWEEALRQAVATAALVAALYFLAHDVRAEDPGYRWIRHAGLNQRWGMFSPAPATVFGWQSIEGHLADGSVVDLLTGGLYPPGHYRREPRWIDQRWEEYQIMTMLNSFGSHPAAFLHVVVGEWNARHPDRRVTEARVLWHRRVTQPDYLLPEETREVLATYP